MEHENVNGVKLTLKIDKRNSSPHSKQFIISYKETDKSSIWPKVSLLFAIIFNVVSLVYVRISLTALLVIVIVLSFLVFFWITHSVQSESLLVIPTVGIHSSVKYVLGREDYFVSWSNIDDVIINEVIKMNCVLYYLTILVKQSNVNNPHNYTDNLKLIPLFKYTKPRLVMLEKVYSEIQTLLIAYEKNNKGISKEKMEDQEF